MYRTGDLGTDKWIERLENEIDRLRDFLGEALEEWEYNSGYKGEYLQGKHGDLERIAGIKAALKARGSDV